MATVTFGNTEISKIDFEKKVIEKGTQVQLNLEMGYKVSVSTDPTKAAIFTRLELKDADEDRLHAAVEYMTIVSVSEAVDNMEDYLKREVVPAVMARSCDRFRGLTAVLGLPGDLPGAKFPVHEM